MAGKRSSGFGRGWVPAERDIGLPNDPVAQISGRYAPLNQARGTGVEIVREDEVYDFAHLLFGPDHDERGEGEQAGPDPALLGQAQSERGEGQQVRSNTFSPARQVQFLHHLAAHGNVRQACAEVGLSAQAAYVHKRRDAALAQGWEAALVLARDAAEQVLADRAINGTSETIYYRGEAVGRRVRFDSRLLLAHIARLDAHYAEAERGRETAARFDEFLEALLGGEADAAELATSEGWTPRRASRADHIAKALRQTEHALLADDEPEPDAAQSGNEDAYDDDDDEDAAALEEAAAYDEQGWAEWNALFVAAKAEARAAAAAVWDAAAAERHARIDALTAEADADAWLAPIPPAYEVKSLPEEVLWPKRFPWPEWVPCTVSTMSTWPSRRRQKPAQVLGWTAFRLSRPAR
jgi:hypothetical protein